MQPPQQIKNYKSIQEFQKDAQKMARSGWSIANQTSYQPRRGCFELFLKPLAMLRPPKSIIMVTYHAQPPQQMQQMPPPYQQGMPPLQRPMQPQPPYQQGMPPMQPPYQQGYDPRR